MAFPFPLKTTAVLAFLSATSLISAAPYVDWMNDYTGNEANTIALWKFDADPGYNLNSYDGSANPNAYPVSNVNIGTVSTGVAGKFGTGAALIDNGGDNNSRVYSINNSSTIFNGSAISVEMWYKTPETVDTVGYLFDKMYTTSDGIRMSFTSGGNLSLRVGNGTTTATLNTSAPILSANTWYHFAATYENVAGNGILKMYMNGMLLDQTTVINFGDLTASTRVWTIGNRSASSYSPLLGTYDNIRISDVAYEYSNLIPEPGIALLGALGLGTLFTRRRS